MTCRHEPGDPACGSSPEGQAREARRREQYRQKEAEAREAELLARTPNPDVFEVMEVEQVGQHLVVKVRYSSCTKCSFDAQKVMVFFDAKVKDVIYWKRIDPHFQNPPAVDDRKVAPSPRARFPADDAGWDDALEFARSKQVRLAEDA
jgi:hypothetical protein